MFAPKVAKLRANASAGPTIRLAPQRSALAGRGLGHDPVVQSLFSQHTIGNQATLRQLARRASRPELHSKRDRGNMAGAEAPPIVHEVLRSPGQPLDGATRAFFEPRFGHDFSKVRVYTDRRAGESARAVNALAYTFGKAIVFANRQYAPDSGEGRALLAHELTHVVQQANTNVASGPQAVGERDDSSEVEAATVSQRVLSGQLAGAVASDRTASLRRAVVDEPAGGCGVCLDAEEAGKAAHTIAQHAFTAANRDVTAETPFYYPNDRENGRLDLLRVTKSSTPPFETEIELGEIKPGNVDGIKRGHSDLAFYRQRAEAAQVILGVSRAQATIGFMDLPPPALGGFLPDPTSKCAGQAVTLEGLSGGLYTYTCAPPRSTLPRQQCCGTSIPVPVAKPAEDAKKKENEKTTQAPVSAPAYAFDTEGLKNWLIGYGIPAAIITALIAAVVVAVADPEPVSKLAASIVALLGISAAAATIIAVAITRRVRGDGGGA